MRRRSAQVAVFHLQEIAEDELAKDWGTKRRIKDDLVPDTKRVRKRGIHAASMVINACSHLTEWIGRHLHILTYKHKQDDTITHVQFSI